MFAGHSNPVPSRATFLWVSGDHGSLVGYREGHKPIVIQRRTAAPIRLKTYDRGTIIRTLGDGLGTVTLEGSPRPKARSLKLTQREKQAIIENNLAKKATHANGYRVPKAPSWQQEVSGWSRDHWREMGPPSLFDDCGRGKVDPRRCSISGSGIDPLPPCWHDRQAGGTGEDLHPPHPIPGACSWRWADVTGPSL